MAYWRVGSCLTLVLFLRWHNTAKCALTVLTRNTSRVANYMKGEGLLQHRKAWSVLHVTKILGGMHVFGLCMLRWRGRVLLLQKQHVNCGLIILAGCTSGERNWSRIYREGVAGWVDYLKDRIWFTLQMPKCNIWDVLGKGVSWLVGLDLFNDDTCPSGHISHPTQVNVSQGCFHSLKNYSSLIILYASEG